MHVTYAFACVSEHGIFVDTCGYYICIYMHTDTQQYTCFSPYFRENMPRKVASPLPLPTITSVVGTSLRKSDLFIYNL